MKKILQRCVAKILVMIVVPGLVVGPIAYGQNESESAPPEVSLQDLIGGDLGLPPAETDDSGQETQANESQSELQLMSGVSVSTSGGQGTAGGGSLESLLPKTAASNFSVDPFTGAGSLSLPLALPAGRAGMNPLLGLSYSTQGSNGLLGQGWNVMFSYIERSAKRGVPRFDENDSFVAVINGATMDLVKFTDGSYRARAESEFMRFEFDGEVWTAKDRMGNTYTFGLDTLLQDDSRRKDDQGRVYRWYLSEVKDRVGNYYWLRRFDNGSFEMLYTGEPGTDERPLSDASHGFAVRVLGELEDNDRPDPMLTYRYGDKEEIRHRLKQISIYTKDRLWRRYVFDYAVSRRSGRSLLVGITEVGADGVSVLPTVRLTYSDEPISYEVSSLGDDPIVGDRMWNFRGDGGYDRGYENYGPCNPITMCYGVAWSGVITARQYVWDRVNWSIDDNANLYFQSDKDTAVHFWTYVYLNNAKNLHVPYATNEGVIGFWLNGEYGTPRFGDWDLKEGYNLIELTAYHQHQSFYFNLNKALAQEAALVHSKQVIVPTLSGDFNGDGFTDLGTFFPVDGEVKIALNTGRTLAPKELWLSNWSHNLPVSLGDFNADGKVDVISYDPKGPYWRVAVSEGDRLNYLGQWLDTYWPDGEFAVGDFDGDGYTDGVLFLKQNGRRVARFVANNQQGKFLPVMDLVVDLGEESVKPLVADINGDGLADLVSFNKDLGRWLFYFNTGGFKKGFVAVSLAAEGYASGHDGIAMDFNGDGKVDIGYFDRAQGKIFYRLQGRDGFESERSVPVEFGLRSGHAQLQTGDLNGDGLLDWIVYDDLGHRETALSSGRVGDVLVSIDNGMGAVTEIVYETTPHLPETKMPVVMPVVKQVTRRSPFGTKITLRYEYHNGRYDVSEREFFGFERVAVVDAAGTKQISIYDNTDYYLRGRPLQNWVEDKSGRIYSRSETQWVKEVLGGPAQTPSVFVYAARRDDFEFDLDGSGRRTAVETFYEESPQYGNITRTRQLGEVDFTTGADINGDEREVRVQYAKNDDPQVWILGLPAIQSTYDASGTLIRRTFSYYDGHDDLSARPVQGLLTKAASWAGDEPGQKNPWVTYEYDSYGNLIEEIDSLGRRTVYEYDSEHHMFRVKTINPLGFTVTTRYYGVDGEPFEDGQGFYGLWGQVKTVVDVNGVSGHKIYDVFGRLVKGLTQFDTPSRPLTQTLYSIRPDHLLVKTINRTEHNGDEVLMSCSFFDGFGRLIQTKTPSPVSGLMIVSDQSELDERGLVVKQYLPFSDTSPCDELSPQDTNKPGAVMEYDELGRLVKTTQPDGRYASVIHDVWRTSHIDANGHRSETVLDAYGRVIERIEYTGADGRHPNYPLRPYAVYARTQYRYDTEGNLIEVKDAHGNITTITYDVLGRKVAMRDPDMGDWRYEYDEAGRLITQIDAKGQRTSFEYDALDRLKKKVLADGSVVAYEYDDPAVMFSKGRMTKVTYGTNESTRFYYDAFGREVRTVKTVDGIAYEVKREFDAMDRLRTLTYPDGRRIEYRYNNAGGLESVIESGAQVNQDPNDGTTPLSCLDAKQDTFGKAKVNKDKLGRVVLSWMQRALQGFQQMVQRINPFSVNEAWAQNTPSQSGLTREVWDNLRGGTLYDLVHDPRYPDNPSRVQVINAFETPVDDGYLYGQRVRGYLLPPLEGQYTFYIASDDFSELYLSLSADASLKERIAYVDGWTSPQQWDKYASQRSGEVYLQAGQAYYIEAVHTEGGGGDHLSVAWRRPDGVFEVIPADFLRPVDWTPSGDTGTGDTGPSGGSDGSVDHSTGEGSSDTTPSGILDAPVLNDLTWDGQVVLIQWTAVDGAASYVMEVVSQTGDLIDSVFITADQTSTIYTPPSKDATYLITVAAVSDQGERGIASNTQTITIPADETNAEGSSSEADGGSQDGSGALAAPVVTVKERNQRLDLQWEPVEGALSYRVHYSDEPPVHAVAGLIDDGACVAAWDFDSGLDSLCGPTAIGLQSLGTLGLDSIGRIEKGVEFYAGSSGNNASLVASSSSALNNLIPRSLAVWIRPDSLGSYNNGTILSKNYQDGWTLRLDSGNRIQYTQAFAGGVVTWVTPVDSIELGEWQQITVLDTGEGDPMIYINGVLQPLERWNTPFGARDDDSRFTLQIGAEGDVNEFDGVIDEVLVLNRILSAEEIMGLITAGIKGSPHPAFKWSLDLGYATKASLTNLENGTVYYIAVGALDDLGKEGPLSDIVTATPNQPAPKVFVSRIVYDELGRRSQLVYGNGVVERYFYDDLTMLMVRKTTTAATGEVIQDLRYEYDGAGQVISVTDVVRPEHSQSFVYDELNRLIEATGVYGTKTYRYDEIGNLIEKDGRTYTYGENGAGPHAVTALSDGSSFVYDANGNMIERIENGVVTHYQYDPENRLTAVEKNGVSVARYFYDGDGGRTKGVYYRPGAENKSTCFLAGTLITMADGTKKRIEEIRVGDKVLGYDTKTLTLEPVTVTQTFKEEGVAEYYILNGNIAVTGNHLVYSRGQWRKVEELNTDNVLINEQLEEKEIKTLQKIHVQNPVQVYNIEVDRHHNYFAGGVLVHNKIGYEDLAGVGGADHETVVYIGKMYEVKGETQTLHIFAGDERLGSLTDDSILFSHGDHLGSAQVLTDEASLVVQRVAYTPYGMFAIKETANGLADVPFRHYFTGQRWEPDIGLYDYVARFYDPSLGRFIQADTVIQDLIGNPQTINRYTYTGNNPINFTDPSGHFFQFIFSVIQAVISAAIAHPVITGAIIGAAAGGIQSYRASGRVDPLSVALGALQGAASGGTLGLSAAKAAEAGIGAGLGLLKGAAAASLASQIASAAGDERLNEGLQYASMGLTGAYAIWNIGIGIKFWIHEPEAKIILPDGSVGTAADIDKYGKLLVPGVHTGESVAIEKARLLNMPVFNNPSHGMVADFTEAFLQKTTFTGSIDRKLASILLKTTKAIEINAHSQGTLIVSNAFLHIGLKGGKLAAGSKVFLNASAVSQARGHFSAFLAGVTFKSHTRAFDPINIVGPNLNIIKDITGIIGGLTQGAKQHAMVMYGL